MLDLIKILFIGTPFNSLCFTHVELNKNDDVIFRNDPVFLGPGKDIQGFQNHAGARGVEEISQKLNQTNWEAIHAFFVVTDNFKDAEILSKKTPDQAAMDIAIYGLDPSYFVTLVPLLSKRRRKIENYLLSLKSDITFTGKTKYIIKKTMITMNCSNKMYEQFIFTIAPSTLHDHSNNENF